MKLFGTAGIRGRYLKEVTPELVYRVGLALARYVGNRGSVTVAHDVRTTSPLLAQLVAAGLMSGGVDTISLGLAPTPVLAYSVPHTKSLAGVMITASHNPPEYNGVKVFERTGMEFTRTAEKELEDLILDKDINKFYNEWNSVGKLVENPEIVDDYIRDLVDYTLESLSKGRMFRVAVDCANGAASGITPRVLRELGVKVISINCYPDGLFPGRAPEPRPDVLAEYIDPLADINVEMLLAHDGDADRLALIIPKKGFVKQDLIIALFAREKLMDKKGSIVISVDVGKEVEEIVDKLGGRIVFARLGKTHEKISEVPDVVLAAEPWKLIDPEWGLWTDSIYQAAWLIKIVSKYGKSVKDIIEELPFYPSARLSFRLTSNVEKEHLYHVIKEELIPSLLKGSEKVIEIDGIRVEYHDVSWILIRPSGTEPKLRVYLQAKNKKNLLEILSNIEDKIKSLGKRNHFNIVDVEKQINLERTTR